MERDVHMQRLGAGPQPQFKHHDCTASEALVFQGAGRASAADAIVIGCSPEAKSLDYPAESDLGLGEAQRCSFSRTFVLITASRFGEDENNQILVHDQDANNAVVTPAYTDT
jgi:hypothetical protein